MPRTAPSTDTIATRTAMMAATPGRRLRIGYSRAARLIDLLEERGIIGRSEASGRSREVLDGSNGAPVPERRSGGNSEGRTMADEVADIIAEEKAREEFLKKQNAADSGQ